MTIVDRISKCFRKVAICRWRAEEIMVKAYLMAFILSFISHAAKLCCEVSVSQTKYFYLFSLLCIQESVIGIIQSGHIP